jgi:ARG/rhodanese/phosphatase superfamily protein
MPTNAIAAALDSIVLGPPVVVHNLTMIPLIANRASSTSTLSTPSTRSTSSTLSTSTRSTLGTSSTPSTSTLSTLGTPSTRSTDSGAAAARAEYIVLDEALSDGVVEITEVSEQGSVPDLKFVNRGARPVLIVDGEELLGAKQNRVVNLSILVAANSELTIPVSCVEAGRWRSRSRHFTAAPRTQYATGRAKRMADVSLSMMVRGERVSDQAGVWEDIAAKACRLEADSPTSAMEAIFERHVGSIDEYVAGCRPVEGQVGALFFVGETLIGFDLFDRPSTLSKLLPKLVRSVAVDAIDAVANGDSTHRASRGLRLPRPERADASRRQAEGSASHEHADSAIRARAEQFLAVASEAPQHVTAAVGLGDDLRITAPRVAGAALVTDAHVVHLGAFAL